LGGSDKLHFGGGGKWGGENAAATTTTSKADKTLGNKLSLATMNS